MPRSLAKNITFWRAGGPPLKKQIQETPGERDLFPLESGLLPAQKSEREPCMRLDFICCVEARVVNGSPMRSGRESPHPSCTASAQRLALLFVLFWKHESFRRAEASGVSQSQGSLQKQMRGHFHVFSLLCFSSVHGHGPQGFKERNHAGKRSQRQGRA